MVGYTPAMEEAYHEGYAAGYRQEMGGEPAVCHYEDCSPEAEAWYQGYCDGRMEA